MTLSGTKFFKPALALLILALLFSASFAQKRLNTDRVTMGLTRLDPLENAPPILAFTTVALGGFRGLIANVLWIRGNDLQEDGKYFEMVQLADWITKLQPHFTTVWIHQAWNMAYNISIKFNLPHDRWLWVLRGIELLRDQGLKYNPNEPLIYRELAWFFQHKIGHYLDDAHSYYKAYWVEEMNQALGPGPGKVDFEALMNPRTEEEKARAKVLREKLKMDPKWMKEVDERYGPLEWRLSETSAIYWATVGLEKTQHEELKKDDFISLRRVIFQSLQLAFMRGRLIYPKKGSQDFLYGPNLDIIKQASDSYEEMARLEPDKRDNIGTGHKNFLKTAVYFLYTHNRLTAANEWFKFTKQRFTNSIPAEMDLDQYALSRVTEDVGETDPVKTKSLLESLYERSYFAYATGDDDQAMGLDLFARKVWQRYQRQIGQISLKRVGLEPIETIKQEVLQRLLNPESGLGSEAANQLRTRLGLPPPSAGATNSALAAPGSPAASTNGPVKR